MASLKSTCALLAGLLVCYAMPGSTFAQDTTTVPAATASSPAVGQLSSTNAVGSNTPNTNAATTVMGRADGLVGDVQNLTEGGGLGDAAPPAEKKEDPKLCDIATITEVMKAYKENVNDSDQIRKIQLQLKIGGFDPRGVDGILGSKTDAAFVQLCQDHNVENFFKGEKDTVPPEAKSLLAKHLIGLLFNPEFNLSGGDCGCSRNFATEVVYGFYPYLLAGGDTQEVDFSLLDRIGFHALVIDNSGELQDDLNWRGDSNEDQVTDFIREAHRHRVKVDLTFYASQWVDWKEAEIKKAAKNIAKTAAIKFKKRDRPIVQGLLRLVGGNLSQQVDGVNLYFEIDQEGTSSTQLREIVTRVADELEDIGSSVTLNVILGLYSNQLNRLDNFADFTNILTRDTTIIDKIFVFLPRNTDESSVTRKNSSKAKRDLRYEIAEVFGERYSPAVLRKIVPIVSPADIDHEPLFSDYGEESQFKLDLAYFKDNFAGVGLWPLPLKSTSTEPQISEALITQFRNSDNLNRLGKILNEYSPGFCQFVCPNRAYVYIALGVLFAVLVIFAVVAFFNCRLRKVFKRFYWVFLLLGMFIPLAISVSFSCDPVWAKVVDEVVIGYLVLLVAVGLIHMLMNLSRPKLP